MGRFSVRASFWSLFGCVLTASVVAARADWPTLHGDLQRSGFSTELSPGPFERKWFRTFVDELIGARVEAIVAENLVFVGTYAGNLHALALADGATVWTYHAGAPIGHSPCYAAGRLYLATDGGPAASRLLCLETSSGRLLWEYSAHAGIWSSPAADSQRVYVGDRAGVFHAVDASTGRALWTYRTGAMILKPASITPDGARIVVGSEDMHVYCFAPDGVLLWRSPKLPGLSLRDAAPTIAGDMVIVRTNPAAPFHDVLHEAGDVLRDAQRALPLAPDDKVIVDTENMYFLRRTPRRETAEYAATRKYLGQKLSHRTWHTLRLTDGSVGPLVPVLYTGGMHNPPSPPTCDPHTGALYTIMPTALSVYCSGVSQVGIGIGRVDPTSGRIENIAHAEGDREPGYFAGMPMITDETSTLGLAGNFLLVTHMGALGGVDLVTRKIRPIFGTRDTYGGLFGPGAVRGSWQGAADLARRGFVVNTLNEWHGPDRSMAAVSDARLLWVAGSSVVCVAGPDVPAAPGGGAKPPEPFRWGEMPRIDGGNITGPLGSYDAASPRLPLTAADIETYLAEPAAASRGDPPSEITMPLEHAIAELIKDGPWAPFVVELGISREDVHFTSPGETLRVVAAALPFLSADGRAEVIDWLDAQWETGIPAASTQQQTGRRREYYDLAPEVLERTARTTPDDSPLETCRAAWAYAHYAGRWQRVLSHAEELARRTRDELTRPWDFSPDGEDGRAVARLNRRIAGLVAYARIMRRAQRNEDAASATKQLVAALAERIHVEAADRRLQTRRDHHAWIARYHDLTPELARALADHAGKAFASNLADLNRQMPVWHQAWGERLVGGENYTNPPQLSHGLFLAHAFSPAASLEQLLRRLDHPWCRADLYWIEKLTAAAALAPR